MNNKSGIVLLLIVILLLILNTMKKVEYSNIFSSNTNLEKLNLNMEWINEEEVIVPKEGYYIDKYGSEIPKGYINILDFIPKNINNINDIGNQSELIEIVMEYIIITDGRIYIEESFVHVIK